MPGPGFAVLDFETTGLFPGGHDRVVEVAVVHVDPNGTITGRWDTLLNPDRDLGRQDIHRITAAEIMHAPTFAQIAPKLIELLSGRVVVAHNASFDVRFLKAELARIGYDPQLAIDPLCTMQLARDFLPGSGRALADCCAHYDIELVGAHRASVDAFATAQLLQAYLLSQPMWNGWGRQLAHCDKLWPPLPPSGVDWMPRGQRRNDPARFLERISIKLPDFSGPPAQQDYLALLDRCLLDRNISKHEADSLVGVAESVGISRTTCVELHAKYFDQLVTVAWADGTLSMDEIADLVTVARLLSIPAEVVQKAMTPPVPSGAPGIGSSDSSPVAAFVLVAGDLIVLTGEMSIPREQWYADLRDHGYVPWDAITKKVKLLAAADPDTLSGKAKKARDYGIPVVSEPGLRELING